MNSSTSDIAEEVRKYCAKIGADPLLVQGAGGNVSWKEDDILWVKASGTWLANAKKEEIFIPVDLAHLSAEIAKKNLSVSPKVIGDLTLRPSIETMLHALMPHRVVLHLHAVEVLAHLVRDDFLDCFESLLDDIVSWTVVEYLKPGASLAAGIQAALTQQPSVNVIFLKNHGVVIGGADVPEVNRTLCNLTRALSIDRATIHHTSPLLSNPPKNLFDRYVFIADAEIQQLALAPDLFKRLSSDWALYPDHVVFLGPKAYVYPTWEAFDEQNISFDLFPELVFISGEGVYAKSSFTTSKLAQLRCYFDVIVRQKNDCPLIVLSDNQIAELLNWDAEQYRMNLAR